jgi:hypothetical protein
MSSPRHMYVDALTLDSWLTMLGYFQGSAIMLLNRWSFKGSVRMPLRLQQVAQGIVQAEISRDAVHQHFRDLTLSTM